MAVFASGNGSNLRSLIERITAGDLRNVRIALVVSNNSRSGALGLARQYGLKAVHLSSRTHPDSGAFEKTLMSLLERHRIHLILLAGYMKLLPPAVVRAYSRRILNIHPALLPRFGGKGMYGLRVHQAVLRSGDGESGATVHFANERYDEGSIIAQRRVPVLKGDTPESLAARVLEAEHDLYWRVVDSLINERPFP
jgi:phosphoribosylglycinamide formyltransferase-1